MYLKSLRQALWKLILTTRSLGYLSRLVAGAVPKTHFTTERGLGMKLGEDEQKVAEYFFKGGEDVANMSVLTNRRLVVVYGNAEESYPLSKITAVKIIFNRSWKLMILGGLLAIIGLAMLWSTPLAGLLILAIGCVIVFWGWRGKTRLLISQMGGQKYYDVSGKDPKLTDFMDAVNSKLT